MLALGSACAGPCAASEVLLMQPRLELYCCQVLKTIETKV